MQNLNNLREIVKALGRIFILFCRTESIKEILLIRLMKILYITYETKHNIANVLNSYFANIGKHISESMNAEPSDHYQCLKGNNAYSLFMDLVTRADAD